MKKLSFPGSLFRSVLKRNWWKVVLLSLLTILQSVLQVALAVITRFVIDSALGDKTQFPFWGAALVADSLLLIAVHMILIWNSGKTMDCVTAELRERILRSAVYSYGEQRHRYHSGELLNRAMEDVRGICEGTFQAIPVLAGQITRLVATFAAVILIYPGVAAVLFAVAAIMAVGVALLRPVLKRHYRNVRCRDTEVMSTMQEDLQQLELIQSLGAQKQTLQRFAQKVALSLQAKKHRRKWTVSTNGLVHCTSQLGSGFLLLWGCMQIADGTLSYGSLTSMLQLLTLFRGPVLSLSGVWMQLTGVEVAVERLQGLLEEREPEKDLAVSGKIKAIVFEDVTFAYPGDDAPVLEHFSKRFPLEGWACLTGISGKGKSTMFKLMLGLHMPQEGSVYLETDEGKVPCGENTRHLFAYVPQDYALFSGTVLENMRLVDPDVDTQRLEEILRMVRGDFLMEMSGGVETVLGENNTGLSMGQLQRLAIARAILMDRPILLLDECTSALDMQTEKDVLENLRKLGKQAILVTHRPEALEGLSDVISVSME